MNIKLNYSFSVHEFMLLPETFKSYIGFVLLLFRTCAMILHPKCLFLPEEFDFFFWPTWVIAGANSVTLTFKSVYLIVFGGGGALGCAKVRTIWQPFSPLAASYLRLEQHGICLVNCSLCVFVRRSLFPFSPRKDLKKSCFYLWNCQWQKTVLPPSVFRN